MLQALLLSSVLTWDLKAWVASIVFGVLTYYLYKYYERVRKLPPGPIPLPFLGNTLNWRFSKKPIFMQIAEWKNKYGPVYRCSQGLDHIITVTDLELAKDAFITRGTDFANRMDVPADFFYPAPGNVRSVTIEPYSPRWTAIRRVGHAAVLEYVRSDKICNGVADATDQAMDLMLKENKLGEPFDYSSYFHKIIHTFMGSAALGQNYTLDHPDLAKLDRMIFAVMKDLSLNMNISYYPLSWQPILKKLLSFKLHTSDKYEMVYFTKEKFQEARKYYEEGVVNNFADALLEAKRKAVEDNKESMPYLTDLNLSILILDLFFAGSLSSSFQLGWILLYMAYYPELQQKMRDEVAEILGDRIATNEDKANCHYINAFMAEVMRVRPLGPLGFARATTCDTYLGDYKLPKGTNVQLHIWSIHNDEKYWKEPAVFNPDRFLDDDGHFTEKSAFVTFGMGRRVCLGEKFALADMKLATIRMLQKTAGLRFVLPKGTGPEILEPNRVHGTMTQCDPTDFKVILQKAD